MVAFTLIGLIGSLLFFMALVSGKRPGPSR